MLYNAVQAVLASNQEMFRGVNISLVENEDDVLNQLPSTLPQCLQLTVGMIFEVGCLDSYAPDVLAVEYLGSFRFDGFANSQEVDSG